MRLLDLFCGAGGASMGYHRAGFEVVGVDINPQPHYPFEFHQADAMTFPLDGFDFVHASPPCQRFSPISRYQRVAQNYEDLVEAVRQKFMQHDPLNIAFGWVIENVPNAPLRKDLILCGQQFSLPIYRHRVFESNKELIAPPICTHPYATRQPWSGYQLLENGVITVVGHTYRLAEGRQAMGIDWMKTREELNEAIPPAYTEFIGKQLR